MSRKKPGIYAPLSAYYFDDVAIMEAGEDAELLYVRMLAYAARQIEREGFIPEQVVLSRLGILPVVGTGGGNGGGSDAGTRAGKLVESGLLEKVDGGYRIRSWLKWNRSAEEVESTRQKDRDRKSADSSGSTKPGTGNGGGNGGGNEDGKLPGSGDQIQKQNQKQNQKQTKPLSDDVVALLDHLDSRPKALDCKTTGHLKKSKDQMRLLVTADNRDPKRIHQVIDYATSGWWAGKVLDAERLRDKYDTLQTQLRNKEQDSKAHSEQVIFDRYAGLPQ